MLQEYTYAIKMESKFFIFKFQSYKKTGNCNLLYFSRVLLLVEYFQFSFDHLPVALGTQISSYLQERIYVIHIIP